MSVIDLCFHMAFLEMQWTFTVVEPFARHLWDWNLETFFWPPRRTQMGFPPLPYKLPGTDLLLTLYRPWDLQQLKLNPNKPTKKNSELRGSESEKTQSEQKNTHLGTGGHTQTAPSTISPQELSESWEDSGPWNQWQKGEEASAKGKWAWSSQLGAICEESHLHFTCPGDIRLK